MKDYERLIAEAAVLAKSLELKNIIISLDENPDPNALFYNGQVLVLHERDYFGNGLTFRKELLNPTWADILRAADEAAEYIDDLHHCYLERVWSEHGTVTFYFGS